MKFYTNMSEYSCGIDLHAKTMYVCIYNNKGEKVIHRNLRQKKHFCGVISKYRHDMVVAAESTFNWYWLADLCRREGIPFVLGHALYMRAIHGAKVKNDRVDSEKISKLLRADMLPQAYAYPAEMRSTRDLMRRRLRFVRERAGLLGHIQLTNYQYNLPAIEYNTRCKKNRGELREHFPSGSVRRSVEADLALIESYNQEIGELEKYILKEAKEIQPEDLELLQSIPGVGKILSLTFIYEIQSIGRFPRVQDFVSYCRAVKSEKTSAGKSYGTTGAKMGNEYLKWALSELVVFSPAHNAEIKAFYSSWKESTNRGKQKVFFEQSLLAQFTTCSNAGRNLI